MTWLRHVGWMTVTISLFMAAAPVGGLDREGEKVHGSPAISLGCTDFPVQDPDEECAALCEALSDAWLAERIDAGQAPTYGEYLAYRTGCLDFCSY